jgi:hypothetical protein
MFAAALALLLAACMLATLPRAQRAGAAAASTRAANDVSLYQKSVPNVDPAMLAGGVRQPNAVQLSALDNFKSAYGAGAVVRWNQFAGTPDVISGFHTAPSSATPEATARAFVNQNAQLFGVSSDALTLASQKEALGGYLLRFQQRAAGVDVAGGGLGFVLSADKRIRMVLGSTFRDVNIASTTSALDASAAVAEGRRLSSRVERVDVFAQPLRPLRHTG